MKDREPKLIINVMDLPCFSYFFKVYKIPIFIVLGLIILAGITLLLIFLLRNDSDNKNSSIISINNSIMPFDYFIKAIYTSQDSETINIISDMYNLNKINNMSINGEITKPTKTYQFKEKGEHIIYFSFNGINNESLLMEGRGLFNGIERLINIEFSNFSENYPDVSFNSMFNNCINLLGVDLSNLKLDYNLNYIFFDIYISEYYSSMDYMFNYSISIKSAELKNFKKMGIPRKNAKFFKKNGNYGKNVKIGKK